MYCIKIAAVYLVPFLLLASINAASEEEETTTANSFTGEETIEALEARAKYYIANIESTASAQCTNLVNADWNFASNITDANRKASPYNGFARQVVRNLYSSIQNQGPRYFVFQKCRPQIERVSPEVKAALRYAAFKKEIWKNVTSFPWKKFQDNTLRRQFKFMSTLGTDALSSEKLEKFTNLVNEMSSIYSTAKVCDYKSPDKCDLSLDPELKNILAKSRNYDELEHVWTQFREVTGKKMKSLYPEYVSLINEAANINGFPDAQKLWLMPYESDEFQTTIYKLWDQILPLYEQLHAYVRRKLREKYGPNKISNTEPIPAHVLGDMWGQHWNDLLDFTIPYPEKESVDVTEAMIEQNYTALKMFKVSEEFFTSVNLTKMPDEFWSGSIIEKPRDREMICHASAWDFCDGINFRIKQCTRVKMSDLVVVHHEMGHIMYYLLYKNQQITFREGANPGFHEAVGDLMALSVSTPKHLKEIGLLSNFLDDDKFNINYLFSQALDKVAFIPSALVIEQWRWDAFTGAVGPKNYNCHWWKLREKYQGVKPPKPRSSSSFDPGAKYHIPASVPYIRYFVSHVIQFQFHKALCIAAEQYDRNDPSKPLHKCDIYKSVAAGNKLRSMLEIGSSKPWTEAMEQITGQKEMDASAILEYFQPLYEWLKEENAKVNETVGWKPNDQTSSCVAENEEKQM